MTDPDTLTPDRTTSEMIADAVVAMMALDLDRKSWADVLNPGHAACSEQWRDMIRVAS